MLLSDFFKYLTMGELAQFSLGTANNGNIAETDYPKIVTAINLGLTDLHTLLPLRTEQLLLQTTPSRTRYDLLSMYAVSNIASVSPSKYILDSYNPFFSDTLLKIERVVSESGLPFTLNDSSDALTVYTPVYNAIQFATAPTGRVAVVYKANHATISISRGLDPTSISLSIPSTLIGPLLTYVASKVMSSKGGTEGIQTSAFLSQQYDKQISLLNLHDMFPTDITTSDRIWRDRWV